eukprot:TRINITY_DN49558_c0_g1_i1.p1 TRINITY_DN49558_c0_g1~~TRINITY_DN49558_c0_g1_i1.p1  ORF type:complete len:439 (-),score=57.95 TRINITY_DN49558_c0_g1_i1:28-1344(-)
MCRCTVLAAFVGWSLIHGVPASAQLIPWTRERAADWMERQPWRAGTNYLPSTASNVLDLWDARNFTETLSVVTREFDLARRLGFSTMRIFLHEVFFHKEGAAFIKRIDQFLDVMQAAGLSAMLVLFDAVWRPDLENAKPFPRVHNSAWVQCPSHDVLRAYGEGSTDAVTRLRRYVEGVVTAFRNDKRVVVWDVYNEPSMFVSEGLLFPKLALRHGWEHPPKHWVWDAEKLSFTLKLLLASFEWVRGCKPDQPLTAGVWRYPDDPNDQSDPHAVFYNIQLELSDVLSLHCYCSTDELQHRIESLKARGRPVLLTEFVARPQQSTWQESLPILHRLGVWGYAWGFVRGRSQTEYAWDTWSAHPDDLPQEPPVWFHDLLHEDGRPYDPEEAKAIWWHTTGMNMPRLGPPVEEFKAIVVDSLDSVGTHRIGTTPKIAAPRRT